MALNERNTFAVGPFFRGALAGIGAAIAWGMVWAVVAKLTGYRGGLIAIFTGVVVTKAIVRGSGGRRGPVMQVLAIALSLFGIWVGKGLCATWSFYDVLAPQLGVSDESPVVAHVFLFVLGFLAMVSPFDALWYIFAIYDGWRRARAVRVPIEGPYSLSPVPQAPGALQFESVEQSVSPPTEHRE